MADKIFVGFSTSEESARVGRSWALYDVDLVRRDLLNHFHTRKGERVMRPEFGCDIWDKLMEPMTTGLRGEILDEVRRICEFDSRVVVQEVDVYSADHTIVVTALLEYLPSHTVQELEITFDRRQEF
jgi:phage baseplate assembly protein W